MVFPSIGARTQRSLLDGRRPIFSSHFEHARLSNVNVLSHIDASPARDRTVVVPNLGGFAGVSWRLPTAKLSFGYRADFFFGAIDGGLTDL